MFISKKHLTMNEIIIQGLVVIISVVFAVIVAELLRKRNFREQKKLDALYNLVAYRHELHSKEFLSSINSIKLLFSNDTNVKSLVNSLYDAYQMENIDLADQLLLDIIKRISALQGFKNITDEDLQKVFKKHKVTLLKDCEQWHGGSQDIIKVFIDNKWWANWNFDETLTNIDVIK